METMTAAIDALASRGFTEMLGTANARARHQGPRSRQLIERRRVVMDFGNRDFNSSRSS